MKIVTTGRKKNLMIIKYLLFAFFGDTLTYKWRCVLDKTLIDKVCQ